MTGTVIKVSEIERMRFSGSNEANNESPNQSKSLDRDRHSISVSRVSNWSNTVQANRAMHLKARIREKEKKEEKQRDEDIQEAEFQMMKREELISRANEVLVCESARMKAFSSAMMLSDVLAERASQIEMKEHLQRLEDLRELKYEELLKHNISRMNEHEKQEMDKSRQLRSSVAKMQRDQLEEAKSRKLEELRASEQEGKLIRALNQRYIEEDLERKHQSRQVALRACSETMRAQKYLNEIRARGEEQDKKEDALIAEYAAQKDQLAEKRKQREEYLFRTKQENQQKLIDFQVAKLADMRKNEEARIASQCREADEDQKRVIDEKTAKHKELKTEIEVDRRAHIEMKSRERQMRTENEKRAAKIAQLIFQKMESDEMQQEIERRDAAKRLSRDLLTQIEIKKQSHGDELQSQKEIVRRAKRAINADAFEFQNYCEKHIREYAENGKNVVPLIQALKSFHCHKND